MEYTLPTLNLEILEKMAVAKALHKAGSVHMAADLLGISPDAVRRRIKKHQILWIPTLKKVVFLRDSHRRVTIIVEEADEKSHAVVTWTPATDHMDITCNLPSGGHVSMYNGKGREALKVLGDTGLPSHQSLAKLGELIGDLGDFVAVLPVMMEMAALETDDVDKYATKLEQRMREQGISLPS